jgi:hypothetical protein
MRFNILYKKNEMEMNIMVAVSTDVNLFRVLSMTTKYASSNISSSSIFSVALSVLFILSCRLLAILRLFSSFRESGSDETGETGAEIDVPPSFDLNPIKD